MIRLYRQCDKGTAGIAYPDGGAVLDQPTVLLDAFAVIGDQLFRCRDAKRD